MKWKVLAGLRFFLAWIVVSDHTRFFIPGADGNPLFIFSKLNAMAAVLGFLLISGYSIAHSLIKQPKEFYQRRVLRIYPLYFFAVLVSLIPFWILGDTIQVPRQEFVQPTIWTAFGNFLLLQGFAVRTIQINPVLWTLSIEVLCYLLAPVFIKLSSKVLILLIGLSASFYLAFPFIYNALFPTTRLPFYTSLQYGIAFCLLLWAWLLGFLYARQNEATALKIALIGLGCLLLLLNQNHTGKAGIFTYGLSSGVLIFASQIKLPSFLLNSLNYLGNISYPLYLFHVPTLIFCYAGLGIKTPETLAFIAILVAMLFYHAVDIPLRSRRVVLPA
ncbi:acyltransferase [Leptolyngbya sp. FACHB-261]|uniref:acyltransferase family protein n=1 Tax=Leptolyngbya sp. FACHB-261 TaxID=2692806 RepID=UPI0016837470|nr:acyltransferase [Leptolyngbya sp. FACHB-261]MBD2102620.1 acyltransferase [Leptolyngbya sp. FACHB-261]